jgi:hypothetical protein
VGGAGSPAVGESVGVGVGVGVRVVVVVPWERWPSAFSFSFLVFLFWNLVSLGVLILDRDD